MTRDLKSSTSPQTTLAPAARTATANGTSIDLRGFDSAGVLVTFGAYTDGTHTPSLQHSADGSTWNNVAAADLDGAFAAVSSGAGANTVQYVGYLGALRFVRVVMTVAGATTGAITAAHIIRGHATQQPVV